MLSDNQVILVVENELNICLSVAELLECNNFVVFTATSVEEALKILNVSDNIDLLISDIDLGTSFDGFDLALTARKMFQKLPVIFVTGSNKAFKISTNSRILIKPYDDSMLIATVKEVLLQ